MRITRCLSMSAAMLLMISCGGNKVDEEATPAEVDYSVTIDTSTTIKIEGIDTTITETITETINETPMAGEETGTMDPSLPNTIDKAKAEGLKALDRGKAELQNTVSRGHALMEDAKNIGAHTTNGQQMLQNASPELQEKVNELQQTTPENAGGAINKPAEPGVGTPTQPTPPPPAPAPQVPVVPSPPAP